MNITLLYTFVLTVLFKHNNVIISIIEEFIAIVAKETHKFIFIVNLSILETVQIS